MQRKDRKDFFAAAKELRAEAVANILENRLGASREVCP
jgi:hypothetical protein